jgi:two-component system NtrC family sensor kinase
MNRPRRDFRSALSVAGTYAVLASLWIVVSDFGIGLFTGDSVRFLLLNGAKGLFFVAVTSTILFFLVRGHLVRIRAIDEQLGRVERMRRLGEVAAVITHDFNNVLMTCNSFTEILRRTTTDRRSLSAIQHIADALARGTAMTREILTFAQPRPPVLSQVPVAPFLGRFADEIRPTMPSIEVVYSVTPGALAVCADPDQLHRLLLNLAMNGSDAMPNGGKLEFTVRPAPRPPSHLAHFSSREERFAEIEVSDTGAGIAPELVERIFEPHFTTKRNGTGLGLAIVHRIVDDHGGYMRAASQVGAGTRISIALPLCTSGRCAHDTADPAP